MSIFPIDQMTCLATIIGCQGTQPAPPARAEASGRLRCPHILTCRRRSQRESAVRDPIELASVIAAREWLGCEIVRGHKVVRCMMQERSACVLASQSVPRSSA
jgi:hypothetical protein